MEYREFRTEVTEEGGKLSGVAAPFGREAIIGDLDRGGWREEIAPGAFAKALRESDTVLLCDHDMSKPLARVSAGTLRLSETARDLEFNADIAETSYARDLLVNVRAGNKGGMSIGFKPVKDDWFDEDGNAASRMTGIKRVIREVKLPEVSCVTNPAYKETAVFARDDDAAALLEERASSVSAADRKADAAKGHALPDGSYPIPDLAHLHAAAILAASHHGDWKAAKELIRRRAHELGVNVDNLPGFGPHDGDANRCADCDSDECPVALSEARKTQEPDSSTPEAENQDALRTTEQALALKNAAVNWDL